MNKKERIRPRNRREKKMFDACYLVFGRVPTLEEWENWNNHDSGAVKFMLMIADNNYFFKHIDEELH